MQEQAIKDKVKERYGKIALTGNSSEGCCVHTEYCGVSDDVSMAPPLQIAKNIGYNSYTSIHRYFEDSQPVRA